MAKGFVGIPVTHDELVKVLEDVLQRVKEWDSFEGFINYLMPITFDEELDKKYQEDGIYAILEARYRIGNSMGQGGMRMIGKMVDDNET